MTDQLTDVHVTPRAINALKQLPGSQPAGTVLRLTVEGQTCCSYRYGLSFEAGARDDDVVSHHDGLRVAIGPESQPYCTGTVLDYIQTDHGEGFSVRGPSRTDGCACGHS